MPLKAAFSSLTGTPTTISGYGITDAFSGNYNDLTNQPTLFDGAFSSLTGTPTTISGYGITDAFSGDYNDLTNKPVNATTTTDGFMSSADKTKLDGLTNADGSETSITAGTNVTVTGTGTTASPYVVNATGGSSGHYVGELFGGGIVFYVYNNGANGLIASLDDLDDGNGAAWQESAYTLIGVAPQSFYDGAANTTAMVTQDTTANNAGALCDNYTGGSQTDWYLPASWELNLLYNSAFIINTILENDGNGTTNGLNPENVPPTFGRYWSSTEKSSGYAWYYNFYDGNSNYINATNTYRVRAVRAF